MALFTVSTQAMHKYLLILVWLMLLAGSLQAQQKKYIYKDTTEEKLAEDAPADQEIEAPVEEKTSQVIVSPVEEDDSPLADDTRYADTSLYFKQLWIAEDTVRYLKNMKAFGYAAYLDSLLKNRQFELEKAERRRQEGSSNKSSSTESSSSPSSGSVDFSPGFFSSPAITVLLWILAGGFILFILYSLFLKEGAFMRKTKKASAVSVEGEDTEEVKPGTNMDNMIAQALKDKNYRLAVRYQYLKNLHKLAEKGLVQYAADKTNYQYVNELTDAGLRNAFAGITLTYEYVWYGEFDIDDLLYRKLEPGFTGLYNKI
jgi:Domain of unknown function (DUF4129)